ncbi:MAG: hypothetical protein DRN17_05345 [Thermoplasmata archaeon]|nr:MAG: hypothetical protein DRN17_05345 [Thermoplasmata archaeon]
MTKEEAKLIEAYYESGHIVLAETGYVDSYVQAIYEEKGMLVFDTETYSGMPLMDLYMSQFIIAVPVFEVSEDDKVSYVGDPGYYNINKVNGEDV